MLFIAESIHQDRGLRAFGDLWSLLPICRKSTVITVQLSHSAISSACHSVFSETESVCLFVCFVIWNLRDLPDSPSLELG